MKRTWFFGLLLACACATTSGNERIAKAEDERTVRCLRIGTLAGVRDVEGHSSILDETQTPGPSRVVWLHPPAASIIRTIEGDVYRCEAPL